MTPKSAKGSFEAESAAEIHETHAPPGPTTCRACAPCSGAGATRSTGRRSSGSCASVTSAAAPATGAAAVPKRGVGVPRADAGRGGLNRPHPARRLRRRIHLGRTPLGDKGAEAEPGQGASRHLCYDNAPVERIFDLLKAEIGAIVRESREAACADGFRFIEVEYNRIGLREHAGFGYLTPHETEPGCSKTSPPHRMHPLSAIRGTSQGDGIMKQQTIVITGASDGIGAAAARQLAAKGECVVLVGRSPTKTAAVADELNVPYYLADFADLSQVRKLAARLQSAYPRIDVLANNAGGILGRREVTPDGFEVTFQVNHLAPFLLTTLLLPTLRSSSAKVLQTSSIAAQRFGRLDMDDLNNERAYSANKAYGDAKLANILFTRELHRRYHAQGISAAAFHPGSVATNFASDTTSFFRFVYNTPLSRLLLVSPDKGGAALTWLAEGTPGTTWQSGEYYDKNKPARSSDQARDAALARQLWDRSVEMLSL